MFCTQVLSMAQKNPVQAGLFDFTVLLHTSSQKTGLQLRFFRLGWSRDCCRLSSLAAAPFLCGGSWTVLQLQPVTTAWSQSPALKGKMATNYRWWKLYCNTHAITMAVGGIGNTLINEPNEQNVILFGDTCLVPSQLLKIFGWSTNQQVNKIKYTVF